jgi:Sec-independent protein translocase protein TatA
VEFIERHEFARKGCGLLMKELRKARGEDVEEEQKEKKPKKLSKESQELKNKKHKHRDRTKEKTSTHHKSRKRAGVSAAEENNFRFSMPRNKTGREVVVQSISITKRGNRQLQVRVMNNLNLFTNFFVLSLTHGRSRSSAEHIVSISIRTSIPG